MRLLMSRGVLERKSVGVLTCDPGATIIVGQHAHNRAGFERLVEHKQWDKLVNEVPIHPGDFFQINPGTLHAIKAGTLILETQQSSDITYRVYDYDRRDTTGTLRPLHLAQSIDVIILLSLRIAACLRPPRLRALHVWVRRTVTRLNAYGWRGQRRILSPMTLSV